MPGLTLATWNVLHGLRIGQGPGAAADATADPAHLTEQPPPGRLDTPGLLAGATALDVDLLGMQEVDRHQPRSDGVDQAALVAEAVGAADWRFVAAIDGTPGEGYAPATGEGVGGRAAGGARTDAGSASGPTYGIALVSRLPVRRWSVLRFPAARGTLPLLVPGRGFVRVPDEPRVAVAAEVELPGGGTATVATCHLSFVPFANVRQLRRTCAWLTGLPAPRILLGDLNLPGRLPALTSRWTQVARGATYPSWSPRVQWDHVLVDEPAAWTVQDARVVRLPVSDHAALRVELGRG